MEFTVPDFEESWPGSKFVQPFGDASPERLAKGCIDADETFEGTWPFKPNFYDGNGFQQHYVDENSECDSVVVLLHGQPMWGYLYRNMIGALAKSYRVIVPDAMGFGKSETPAGREYCVSAHAKNLIGLLDHLNVKNITLFVQDWGIFIGTLYLLNRPDTVDRVMFGSLANPAAGPPDGDMTLSHARWTHFFESGLCEDPDADYPARYDEREKLGARCRTEEVLLNAGSTVPTIIKHFCGLQTASNCTDTWHRAYMSAFPTKMSAIGCLNFPLEAHRKLRVSEENQVFMTESFANLPKFFEKPVWVAYGAKDRAIEPSESMVQKFRECWPGCPIMCLQDAGHFVQEDCPAELVALLQAFIQSTGGKTTPFQELAGVPKNHLL